MSLINGLFTLPIGFAQQVYKAAYYPLPEEEKEFANVPIKNTMQSFLNQVKIRKDLIFFEMLIPGICVVSETNIANKGHAVIFVTLVFYEADQKAFFLRLNMRSTT